MISEKLIALLKSQIEHEIENSLKYRNIAHWLNVQGFENLSKYYKKWSIEENNHATWIQEFLESLNIFVDYNVISNIELGLNESIIKFAELTKETEFITTQKLKAILDESYREDLSGLVTMFISMTMLKEQIEETDKANTIYDQVKNIGENKALFQLYDKGFGN